jgi:hypothetical protein
MVNGVCFGGLPIVNGFCFGGLPSVNEAIHDLYISFKYSSVSELGMLNGVPTSSLIGGSGCGAAIAPQRPCFVVTSIFSCHLVPVSVIPPLAVSMLHTSHSHETLV